MFTGIVEDLGQVTSLTRLGDSARLAVRTKLPVQDATLGSSVAVNGVCLTVVEQTTDGFVADVMAETLSRSTIGDLGPGDPVNLERAMPADGRLDGHIVQGHVDGTGTVIERIPGERWEVVRVALPAELARYVAEKGSIAIDGTSLTVVEVTDRPAATISVALIPETLARTTLGALPVGGRVNLEVDVIAKYVERLITARPAPHPADDAAAPERQTS
ncbi:riboflavin synthase [Microlunatus elymi]|uniref:Riboflavin synthase n=1 Tax=Microlunatus elymi TaxID=2596828 RepID=A0A516PTN3_9ACTN|nr:riboflavin synthase [Microlunatus elymi]QDP94522.1 riboflavin synthase [Microlunatus elymi]